MNSVSVLPNKSLAGLHFMELVRAVADGVHPIQASVMGAIHRGMGVEEVKNFLHNTPNEKMGKGLWEEFESRKNSSTVKGYSFDTFIQEVNEEVSSQELRATG